MGQRIWKWSKDIHDDDDYDGDDDDDDDDYDGDDDDDDDRTVRHSTSSACVNVAEVEEMILGNKQGAWPPVPH